MTDSLLWRAVSKRTTLFFAIVAVGLALLPLALLVIKPSYHANAKLLLISEDTTRQPLVLSKDLPDLAASHDVLSRVRVMTKLDDSISTIRRHLSVKGGDVLSNMLTITYLNHDQQTAVDVANAVAQQTVAFYHRLSTQQYDTLIAHLLGQLGAQRGVIEKLDRRVQRAAATDSFASSDKAIETITTRLDDLQGKLGDAMATLTADQAIAVATAQQPQAVLGIMHDQQLQSDPLYQNLRSAQAHDAAALDSIKSAYTDRYPGLPYLQDEVSRETRTLNDRKSSVLGNGLSSSPTFAQTLLEGRKDMALVMGDQARVTQYNAQILEQRRRLADIANTGVSVAVLRTERDAAMTTYGALAAQLSTVRANQSEASSLGSLVVIDRAGEATALFDNFFARVAIGLVTVLALAFMLIALIEALDPRLRTPTDIERLYGRPVVATVVA
jgi:capsular polysaccharide biosynthesis protein